MKAKAVFLAACIAVFAAALVYLGIRQASTDIFRLDTFLTALQRAGYEVETEAASSALLRGRATRIALSGKEEQSILLYQYPSAEKAAADAACIDPSGFSITFEEADGAGMTTQIDWAGAPHFYLSRNAIVQYTGSDEELLGLLESLCGPPFAGEGSGAAPDESEELTLE